MDDTTRQLLHDAAPPVPAGSDFDRLWQRAARERRLQRAGQAAATVVLVALAGLVLPFGWGGSLPLLGRDDGDRIGATDDLVSAPLSEWDVVGTGGSRGGPMLGGGGGTFELYVFAIDGGRWCIAGRAGGGGDLEMVPFNESVAARLLCHEARAPGSGQLGTLGALEIGDRVIHWATLAPHVERVGLHADFGSGMTPILDAHMYGGGGIPFMLWAADTTGRTPTAFEVHDPGGGRRPVTVEAPTPRPATVDD